MNVKQEYDRLREAFKKKDQRKQNFLIATVADASPHLTYGFIVATLSDNTPINVQCWTSTSLTNGQFIWVAPMNGSLTQWYVLIGVNSSTDLGTTPFVAPVQQAASIPVHDLDGDAHSGTLSWSKISTSLSKVNLATQTTGNVPISQQDKQTLISSVVITTGSIAASATETNSISGPNVGYVRRLNITGGSNCTLTLYEDASSTVQYGTASVSTPFSDDGGWMFYDTTDSGLWRYAITNDGGSSAVFVVTMQVVGWSIA